MTVQDLIAALITVDDKSQEVFFDVTPANGSYFYFRSIDLIDDVEDGKGNKFIVLACSLPPPIDTSQN